MAQGDGTAIYVGARRIGADELDTHHSLEDYTRVRETLLEQLEVVVIGAGLIGCEFANDLAAAGYSVTVVDVEAWPLARLAPRAVGKALVRHYPP